MVVSQSAFRGFHVTASQSALTRALDALNSSFVYRVPCHIVHLSSSSALPMIRQAREEGVPLTIETTHHYLSLLAEDVPDGATQFKCCPPVRNAKNQVSTVVKR